MGTESPAHREGGSSDLWGHPRQLWMLLTVTIGLSFAFYGFRAYLAPYLAEDFYVTLGPVAAQRRAYLLSSGFLAMLNATPIVGGYVADKILGEARSLAISLWLTSLALVLMSLPTLFGLQIGMALFAMASGLGIAPLSVLIGRGYSRSDPRREAGYTLWYLALNLGAFIGPFICADFVGRRFGYRYGFIAAAAGSALAAIVFQLRQYKLRANLPGGGRRVSGSIAVLGLIVGIAALLYPMALLLSRPQILSGSMYVLMALLMLYIVVGCVRRRDHVQTQRYVALLLLFVALVLFWALSFQGVTSLNFFARDHVTAPFDYTLFQSANPLYILILAPVLALLWPWLAQRGKDPSTPAKFGIGLLLVALSYGLTASGIYATGADGKVAWCVLAGCYLLQTLGELALSPIGYSLIGLLAAPEESSLVMGGWYFGLALAYQSAGWIATRSIAVPGAEPAAYMAGYAQLYGQLFLTGLAASLAYLLAAPWIRKLMHEVH